VAPAISRVQDAVAEGDRSLDQRTELPHWRATVYPTAFEATITFVVPRHAESEHAPVELTEDERAQQNHERATRRAITESRRYMVANRLRYMWVLTFAVGLHGAEGRRECMQRVAAFVQALRRELGSFAYWYSPELHPDGHGWHVNLFVPKRLAHHHVRELWGHGHVWVSDWAKDSRVVDARLGFVDALRLGAQYGCKYASKDWGEDVLAGGAHRYEIAQGFRPRAITVIADSAGAGVRFASVCFGGRRPDRLWSSSESADWDGPPVWCLSWSATDKVRCRDG